jgi:type II secretory pathway component GspD/PulD (secretin)
MIFFKTGLVAGVVLLCLSVQAEESRISLSATNQPLGAVLANIEKASGIDVLLSDKKWAQDPVTFSTKGSDLEKALDTVLSPYDYVLEWYAGGNGFSKVVVTVHERKLGRESVTQSVSVKNSVDDALALLVENGLDDYATAYHQSMKQKDVVYPEGFTEEDIKAMRDGMAKLAETVR